MIPLHIFNVDYLASSARYSMAYLAFILEILDTTLGIELHTFASQHLQLSRLIIHHLCALQQLPGKFDEILVCRVRIHIVISVLCAVEFDYEAVSKGRLIRQELARGASVAQAGSTACASGLLFLPPEKDLMYGFPEAAFTHLSFSASMRLHACR